MLCAAALGLLLAAGPAGSGAASGIVSTIVTNPITGVAIDGFDPVSYFTDPEPREGQSSYEYVWGGASWYFATEANRDAFMRAPEAYAPQFGGHGATSLARGFLSDGNPRLYAIHRHRLYFFYSSGNRDAFIMSPDKAIAEAEANWERLSKELSTR